MIFIALSAVSAAFVPFLDGNNFTLKGTMHNVVRNFLLLSLPCFFANSRSWPEETLQR